jgi:hypothetical protein
MSTVEITFTGYDTGALNTVTLERDEVEDLYALSLFFADAARAAGYTYVESVGFEKDDGEMVFGGF